MQMVLFKVQISSMRILANTSNLLVAFFVLISTCASCQQKEMYVKPDTTIVPRKILIVYLSRTNNTKTIAEIIHKNIGGNIVALELEKPNPENYLAIVQQVVDENETGYLPTLRTKIDSIQNYTHIFIGFPTWGMQLPPPIKSFLNHYDLRGKTVIPFNTNAGYGTGNSFQKVKELCKDCNVLEGFTMKGGIERDGVFFVIKDEKAIEAEIKVKQWLQKIKLIK